jgi:hypothetical protein
MFLQFVSAEADNYQCYKHSLFLNCIGPQDASEAVKLSDAHRWNQDRIASIMLENAEFVPWQHIADRDTLGSVMFACERAYRRMWNDAQRQQDRLNAEAKERAAAEKRQKVQADTVRAVAAINVVRQSRGAPRGTPSAPSSAAAPHHRRCLF